MVRFQALKNFLSANSFEDSKGRIMIYPGLLLEAIREVKVIHRLKNMNKSVRNNSHMVQETPGRAKTSRSFRLRGSGAKI